jgi:hypothetical protein
MRGARFSCAARCSRGAQTFLPHPDFLALPRLALPRLALPRVPQWSLRWRSRPFCAHSAGSPYPTAFGSARRSGVVGEKCCLRLCIPVLSSPPMPNSLGTRPLADPRNRRCHTPCGPMPRMGLGAMAGGPAAERKLAADTTRRRPHLRGAPSHPSRLIAPRIWYCRRSRVARPLPGDLARSSDCGMPDWWVAAGQTRAHRHSAPAPSGTSRRATVCS